MSGTANQQAYGRSGGYGPSFGRWPHDHYQLWALSRPVMIAATIVGFLLWWPLGVVALALAIANKKMGRMAFGCAGRRNGGEGGAWNAPWNTPWTAAMSACGRNARGSGNSAFDEYREQTLRRLEEEQKEFTAFLERLRFARDKAEFDQFMAERRNTPTPPDRPATESAD
jgi:hypothetical protein